MMSLAANVREAFDATRRTRLRASSFFASTGHVLNAEWLHDAYRWAVTLRASRQTDEQSAESQDGSRR
jgi:hypothetical protein